MTLGKVLIAAAWADGTITEEEVNSLKDLLWRLPAVRAREWDELDIYLDSPIDAPERERLAARLRDLTTSAEARDMALQALDDMIAADKPCVIYFPIFVSAAAQLVRQAPDISGLKDG